MTSYRVRAVNTAPDSENRMHADDTAAKYGFRGGLVPGVTVYGYMAQQLGDDWREHGGMQLRLLKPFYDGDTVVVDLDGDTVHARREDGTLCAEGLLMWPALGPVSLDNYPSATLPAERPRASQESLAVGTVLGTLQARLESSEPEKLLSLSNHVLMANVELGPWIHTSSELQNCGRVEAGTEVEVRGRVSDLYERKGHQFVALELAVVDRWRIVQIVRHLAIWRPREQRD